MKNKVPIYLINKYQKATENKVHRCRYFPSCSQYAKECYEKFGFVKASLLTTKRLLKCNPLFKAGYDPVPLTKEEKLKYQSESNEKGDEN